MKTDKLNEAVELAGKLGQVIIATADENGVPHLAAAGQMAQMDSDSVAVSEWFCPGTVRNLQTNPEVAILIWDRDTDTGFQLQGRLTAVRNMGIMDGYDPAAETREILPQEEKQLFIHIHRLMAFSQAPHTDSDLREQELPLFSGQSGSVQ